MTRKQSHTVVDRRIYELKPYPNNARTHSDYQIQLLVGSIQEFGFTAPVLIDEDSVILAGHGRVEAAKLAGLDTVPCVVLDHLSPAQKKAYVIADNKMMLSGSWDTEKLINELKDLQFDSYDVELTGFSEKELQGLANIGEAAMGAVDYETEWEGMPEFDQEDQQSFKRLIVHFATQTHLDQFSDLIDQHIGEKTRSIWFPEAEIGRFAGKSYE